MKITFFVIGLILLLTLIMFLSGCSVVKTAELTSTNNEANMFYYLPKGLLKVTSTVKVFVYVNKTNKHLKKIELISQSFNYEREIVPDNTQSFRLNYVNNALSKDDVDIKINEKGLLTNVDITTEDRLPNIIEALSNAPSDILGIGQADKGTDDQLEVKIEEFSKTFTLDPIDFPKGTPKDIIWAIQKNDNFGNSKDLEVSFTIELASPSKMKPSAKLGANKFVAGIITRPLSLYKFEIKPKATLLDGYLVQFYEYLPDVGMNINVPLSRALFAKKTNNLTFTDGILMENKIEKPSEVEGFISIPINLAKAVVSIPGQLVQFRIDNTKRNTELEKEVLNLEKAITENQRNELLKALEIQKLQLESDKSLLTLQKEIDKLNTEMALMPQVSELENQKKLLGLEKEVTTLISETKELEEKKVLENEKTILTLQKEILSLKEEIEKLKSE